MEAWANLEVDPRHDAPECRLADFGEPRCSEDVAAADVTALDRSRMGAPCSQ
jgi:hypothetical protein